MIEIYINWMDRWTQKITLVHVGSLVTILVCTRKAQQELEETEERAKLAEAQLRF